MTKIPRVLVVSQPMFLPWIGLFEQLRLSNIFIHYDDVQLPQGRSFITRVQIRSGRRISWLTAPIDRAKSRERINKIVFFEGEDWRSKHLSTLRHAYARAPFFKLMFELAEGLYRCPSRYVADFNIAAIEQIGRWLGFLPQFLRSSELGILGAGTERLVQLCEFVKADVYLTGHGALKYLNHQKFEERSIAVQYMDYKKAPYRQGRNEFTPYVSILDAIAYCGEETRDLICSNSIYWKDFSPRAPCLREDD